MAITKKVERRGLWKRETYSTSSWADLEELAREVGWHKSLEEDFREYLDHAISVATKVLEEAGYQTRSGWYLKDANGNFIWLGESGSRVKFETGKSYHTWPYFLPTEALTLQDFAVNLIHNARGYLQAVENGQDKWHLANMGLYFAEALLKFSIESSGIAQMASRAIEVEKGAKAGRSTRTEADNFARQVIATEISKLPTSAPERQNAMNAAQAITRFVNAELAKAKGKKFKIETIQRKIQKMGLLKS